MKFGSEQYLRWQQKINDSKLVRRAVELFGIYAVILFIFFGAYLLYRSPKNFVLAIGAFLLARLILVPAIDRIFKKPHPYQRYKFVPHTAKLFSKLDQVFDAFPSQHVVSLAAVSSALWIFSPAWALTGLALAAAVGIARIILGYHDPYDVLGGLLLGGATGAVLVVFTRY